jgi:cytochrome c biogenesis protein CcmG/thiol:disulfide interchange protein DsbE
MREPEVPLIARLVVAASAVAFLSVACTGGNGQPTGPVSLPASPTALPTFSSSQFKQLLTTLHGTPVVVNVWASWCGPCIVEAPRLARLGREFQGKVQFVGVDIEDQVAPARAFIRKYGWTYPSVFDPTGGIRNGLGYIGQPVTILYDRAGKRVFVNSGAVSEADLRAHITQVLSA